MRWLTAAVFLLAAGFVHAQDVQPVPALTARVIDQTATLDPTQRQALEESLAEYERAAGPQIAVLIVPTTAPEDITTFAQRVADTWKIGRRDVGDGLLIVVAKDDRKMRIEVAKALEGAIPDLAARQIIDTAMKPAFQAGDYAGGLQAALRKLQARIAGEDLPGPASSPARQGGGEGFGFQDLGLLFFIGVPLVGTLLTGMLGRKLGSVATAGAAGAAGWAFGGGLVMAGIAAVAALVLVGLFGIGSARRAVGGRRGGGMLIPPVIFGGGGGFGG
ncbi:MAG: YgcG family protein, partial [Rubrivivax sp.]